MSSRSLSPAERVFQILKQLKEKKDVRIADLSEALGVTQTQIRKDIDWLYDRVPFERFHGGVTLTAPAASAKKGSESASKRCICEYAVKNFIEDKDQLLLDSGTTLEAFVEELKHNRNGILAVSNNAMLGVHFTSWPGSAYIQLGGLLQTESASFSDGTERFDTSNFFNNRASEFLVSHCKGKWKAIITGTGLTSERGLLINTPALLQYKRHYINHATDIYVLLDRSKIGRDAQAVICSFSPTIDNSWLRSDKRFVFIVDTAAISDTQRNELRSFISRSRGQRIEPKSRNKAYKNIHAYVVDTGKMK